MKVTIKDLSTFKKLLSTGKITKLKLLYSKVPSVHVDTVRYVGKLQDNAFILKDRDGGHSWFEYPSMSNIAFDGTDKFRVINGDKVILEYQCLCDSEIPEEELVPSKFHRKSSVLKSLLENAHS